jgi:3-phenylpropionate/cinnamic acid dioxygenase small subunit
VGRGDALSEDRSEADAHEAKRARRTETHQHSDQKQHGEAVIDASVAPELAAFVYLEARLADEARYTEWEALWDADDTLYWVPRHPGADPDSEVSIIYDNRKRLASRVRQLQTGVRHAQTPPSSMRRMITNLEVLAETEDITTVGSNFVLFEYRNEMNVFAGRYVHRVRSTPEGFRLVAKTVHLVNAAGPIPTLAFLI